MTSITSTGNSHSSSAQEQGSFRSSPKDTAAHPGISLAGRIQALALSSEEIPTIIQPTTSTPKTKSNIEVIGRFNFTDAPGNLQASIGNATNANEVMSNNCLPTVYYNLVVVKYVQQEHNTSRPIYSLVSYDSNRQPKTVGGDELFVAFYDDGWRGKYGSHTAFVQDQMDGTYLLDFWTVPFPQEQDKHLTGVGNLQVKLEYTCFIGSLPPPEKDAWADGGNLYLQSNLRTTLPHYQTFRQDPLPKFSNNRLLISFGDSTFRYMVYQPGRKNTPLRSDKQVIWFKNPDRPLDSKTAPQLLLLLDEWHGEELRRGGCALVIGSSVWDVLWGASFPPGKSMWRNQGSAFLDHQRAVRTYATGVLNAWLPYNNTIYWRLPLALNPHKVKQSMCRSHGDCAQNTRYLSRSRIYFLYRKQRLIMRNLGIPVIDVWNASVLAGEHTLGDFDGRHYDESFNSWVLDQQYT